MHQLDPEGTPQLQGLVVEFYGQEAGMVCTAEASPIETLRCRNLVSHIYLVGKPGQIQLQGGVRVTAVTATWGRGVSQG